MSTYFVGDVHGCYKQLRLLLNQASFNPQIDELWLTGDLVARGPDSMSVIKYLLSLGNQVKIVLGNHDLYLIKAYFNALRGINNTIKEYMLNLFKNQDIARYIDWLRKQPLLRIDKNKKIILSHAGILPIWNIKTAEKYAREAEQVISGNNIDKILYLLDSDEKNLVWDSKLNLIDKLKFSINVFTRIRYCYSNSSLNMDIKEYPISESFKLKPWFSMINHDLQDFFIIFGHWASLRGQNTPNKIFALDTGCSWGNYLTLLRWEDKKKFVQSFNC